MSELLDKSKFLKGKMGLGLAIHEVARAWRAKIDERVRPLGLSTATWGVIGTIACTEEPLTQREIADLLFLEGPSVGRLLDRLENMGWVERRPVPGDRRMKHIYLTEKVSPVLENLVQVATELEERFLRDLPEDKLGQAYEIMLALRERLGLAPYADPGGPRKLQSSK